MECCIEPAILSLIDHGRTLSPLHPCNDLWLLLDVPTVIHRLTYIGTPGLVHRPTGPINKFIRTLFGWLVHKLHGNLDWPTLISLALVFHACGAFVPVNNELGRGLEQHISEQVAG